MISAIGLMIGAYIATRMFENLGGSTNSGRIMARICAAVALVVVFVSMLNLLLGSASISDLFGTGSLPLPYARPR